MQKANKLTCAALIMLCMNLYAQTPAANTLNQAIEVIKSRKTSELNTTTRAYSNTPIVETNIKNGKEKMVNSTIKLWSIRGVGNELTAEIIYQEKIVEVSFESQQIKVGKWLLVGITENEVEFAELSKNGKLSPVRLRLKLPKASEVASMWSSSMTDGMNLTEGASRTPVPMSLLRP